MKRGTMGELGASREHRGREQIMMRRHQHAPAASIGAGDWYSIVAPQLHSTKKAADELVTSSCGSAAAGEKLLLRLKKKKKNSRRTLLSAYGFA
jgi:hypothetical protein